MHSVASYPEVAILVLAGGMSRRMGSDKAAVRLGGLSLLDRALDLGARLAPEAPLAVSWNGALAAFEAAAPGRAAALPLLPDPLPDHPGPLAGILAGLDWAAGIGRAQVLTLPVDTPFLPSDCLARLDAAATAGRPALARAPDGLHPAVALWPVAAAPALRVALTAGERRLGRWAQAQGATEAAFPDAAAFANLNTPEDLALAEAGLAGSGPEHRA